MDSPFSEFIRNATPKEKEEVYNRVIDKAIDEQNRTLTAQQKRAIVDGGPENHPQVIEGVTLYVVYSAHGVEQRRKTRKVAEEDIELLWAVAHRKAWIEEETG